MNTTKYLMNVFTGSIDTEENWTLDSALWAKEVGEEVAQNEFHSLVEVEEVDGEWVEVK